MSTLFELPELLTLGGDQFTGVDPEVKKGAACSMGCEVGCYPGCVHGDILEEQQNVVS